MHNYMLPYCRLCGNAYQNMDYPKRKKKLRENEITTHITVLELQSVALSMMGSKGLHILLLFILNGLLKL